MQTRSNEGAEMSDQRFTQNSRYVNYKRAASGAPLLEEYGLVERLRNGGQTDLADMADEVVHALRWVMSATGEGIAGAFDNAERVLAKVDGNRATGA